MTDSEFDFEVRPQARVDSLAGFSTLSFSSMTGSVEEAANNKFSFSPQQDLMDFGAVSSAPFSQGLEQETVHPGVLSGDNNSLLDGQASADLFSSQPLFPSMPNARSQHGQITPPDDLSPKSAESKLAFNSTKDSDIQVKVEDSTEAATASNKRKRSSKASVGGSTRKRGRKSIVVVEDDSQDPEDRAKRDQFLERNRVAAHKCRQKKKEWMVQLDNDCRDLTAKNKYLIAEVNLLSNTLYELKNLVFQHADCGYHPVNEFISNEAEKVRARAQASDPATTAAMREPYQQPSTNFPGRASGMFQGRGSVDLDRSAERASTEASDLGSLRSGSTATDGVLNESWADMLQQQ
ncbi:bzip transcription factor [Diplodia corticola]|uniref:Bzip transcription factor n=1 Tax=Diplodia corticola TaxID=236234 RepID=A0A1J9QS19_9PEZI|nr:bzip transcription factor [Diplodia corticola]OJD31217.1 bzip transcription factor [Diplodia corticola]